MVDGLLGGVGPFFEAPIEICDAEPKGGPDASRSNVIPCLLEERQRFSTAPFQLVHVLLAQVQPRLCCDDFRERLCQVDRRAPAPARRPPLQSLRALPGELRIRQRDFEAHIQRPWACEDERAFEERGCPTLVSTRESPAARGGESLARALCQFPVGLPKLGLVAGRLLEVEAEDLVHLDQIGAALLQPVGEALVELCARRPWKGRRRRRRESRGGGSGTRRRPDSCVRSGRIELLANERGQSRITVPSRSSACTAPRWKISPSTAPRSSTERSGASSWSSRAASSACRFGGTSDIAPGAPPPSPPSPSGRADCRRRRARSGRAARRLRRRDQRVAHRRRAAARAGARRGHSGRRSSELRTGQAEQEDRRASRAARHARSGRGRSPRPTGCRRRRRRAAPAPRAACGTPRRSRRPRCCRSRREASGAARPQPDPTEARRAASAPPRPANT